MTQSPASALGKRVYQRRKKMGLSQAKLAESLGCPQQTVNGWEHGSSARPRLLLELAKVLCTTQEWLLYEEGPEEVVPVTPKQQIAEVMKELDPRLAPAVLEFIRNLGKKDSDAA